jgi:hypothetical protein
LRRARDIFDISDEGWTPDELLLADPSDVRSDPVRGEREPRASERDGPVEERHLIQVFRQSLRRDGIPPSRGKALLLGSALIAGILVLGAGLRPRGAGERPRGEAGVERRARGLSQAPAAKGNAGRPPAWGAARARKSATRSSAAPTAHRSRAVSVPAGPAPSLLAQQRTPGRVAHSDEKPAPGQEFSFER